MEEEQNFSFCSYTSTVVATHIPQIAPDYGTVFEKMVVEQSPRHMSRRKEKSWIKFEQFYFITTNPMGLRCKFFWIYWFYLKKMKMVGEDISSSRKSIGKSNVQWKSKICFVELRTKLKMQSNKRYPIGV